MLTEETKDAILVIEAINPEQAERARAAMEALKQLLSDEMGVTGDIHHLTIDTPDYTID